MSCLQAQSQGAAAAFEWGSLFAGSGVWVECVPDQVASLTFRLPRCSVGNVAGVAEANH